MCWPHVFRNIQPKVRGMVSSVDKKVGKRLLKDLEDLEEGE